MLGRRLPLAAAVVWVATGNLIELPVQTNETGVKGYLQWHSKYQTAEECVQNLKAELGGEQITVMIGKLVKAPGVVRAFPSANSVDLPWDRIPQVLHGILAELTDPPEEAFRVEEAPFRTSLPARLDAVGMFLLIFPGRNGWRVLAKSLRGIWENEGALPAYLHLLVHHPESWQPDAWRKELGEALPILRGMHWCGGRNRFARYNEALVARKPWDNYYHKAFSMLALAEYHGYEYIVSLDDDVLLPPSALAYLARSGRAGDDLNCGVVSPLLQNGVPSVELFAEEFLAPAERAALYQCFGESSAEYIGEDYPELEPLPRPWNAIEWYRRVKFLKRDSDLAHKGLHPVRSNNSCMEVSLALALNHLEEEWTRWRRDHVLFADHSFIYPYFCNNAYLVRTDLYHEVIRQPGLWLGGADEEHLNLVMQAKGLPACFISGSFGIHPAYSTHAEHLDMENTAVALALSVDGSVGISWMKVPNPNSVH